MRKTKKNVAYAPLLRPQGRRLRRERRNKGYKWTNTYGGAYPKNVGREKGKRWKKNGASQEETGGR